MKTPLRERLADRARKYVEKMPPGVSGQGGSQATFEVARVLVHGFALNEADAWQIFCEYNARCEPPWNERDLRHKLEGAGKLSRTQMPKGYLCGQNSEPVPEWMNVTPIPTPDPIPWPSDPTPFQFHPIKGAQQEEEVVEKTTPTRAEPRTGSQEWLTDAFEDETPF